MTDNRFIDIESLEGQAELIARTRRAVDEIGEEASRLSDRLAMRYFTHVSDVGQQTLAA